MILGTWGGDHVVEYEKVKQLTVVSKKARLGVSMDGDVLSLETPLNFTVRPKSLSVLAPEAVVADAPVEPAKETA